MVGQDEPQYSAKYCDDQYEYRHVVLPTDWVARLPRDMHGQYKLMSEDEWRAMGVRQSPGWQHYAVHRPEPHILLFRRLKNSIEAIRSAQYQKQLASAQLVAAQNGGGCN